MKKNLFSQFIHRVTCPTPLFFRKWRRIGVGLSGAGTAILTSAKFVPERFVTIGGYLFVIGLVIVAMASAACTNTPENDKPQG